jgi:putative lipoic acid-binding regulatory protein
MLSGIIVNLALLLLIVAAVHLHSSDAFLHNSLLRHRVQPTLRFMSSDYGGGCDSTEDEPPPPVVTTTPSFTTGNVTIDDGGSDLTDRFKYKVNALMGTYDPKMGLDDEQQFGNIMGALMNFPTQYAFHVVGRTHGNPDDAIKYAEATKEAVISIAGDSKMECVVSPRGKSFTRVSVTVEVESAGMIKTIYDALDEIEATVMKY